MEEYLDERSEPAQENDLQVLEEVLETSLPVEYRQLLQIANGATFKNAYIRLENGRTDWVLSYDSWSSAKSQLNTLINYDNKNNLFVEHQDHLFPIAITSKGNQLFIGLNGEYRDKVFISDQNDDISSDERTVFPVFTVADSLVSFLKLLGPSPLD
jgi:cell wall assembly regulator SMI1